MNLRLLAPKASALAGLSYAPMFHDQLLDVRTLLATELSYAPKFHFFILANDLEGVQELVRFFAFD